MKLIHQINNINHGEVNVTSREVLQLSINVIAMWHATSTSHDHKLLLFIKSCKIQWNFDILNFE
jgi:hypothetical protein